MSPYLLPLLSLILGAALGLFSTLLASSIRQRQDITLKLLDQYFLVRKELVEAVSELSNMSIWDEFDIERRTEYRRSISKLYYKHYDFLPKPVLNALTLLYVCLATPGLYKIERNAIVLMEEFDIIPFIRECSVFTNSRYLAPLALKCDDPEIRIKQSIILHARYVLFTLNKFASIEDLLSLIKKLKKEANI